MNKEEAHDEKISPLMDQIIGICREHGIAMVASFALPTEDDDGLRCTTHLPDGEGNFDDRCAAACAEVRRGTQSMAMMTTEHADGSKTLTAFIG